MATKSETTGGAATGIGDESLIVGGVSVKDYAATYRDVEFFLGNDPDHSSSGDTELPLGDVGPGANITARTSPRQRRGLSRQGAQFPRSARDAQPARLRRQWRRCAVGAGPARVRDRLRRRADAPRDVGSGKQGEDRSRAPVDGHRFRIPARVSGHRVVGLLRVSGTRSRPARRPSASLPSRPRSCSSRSPAVASATRRSSPKRRAS